jgi:hypothetical protein
VFGRLVIAFTPTLVIVAPSLLHIPGTAVTLLAVGLTLALLVSAFTRHRIHALIGGLAVAFPLAVIAIILFARACNEGHGLCG